MSSSTLERHQNENALEGMRLWALARSPVYIGVDQDFKRFEHGIGSY